MGRQLVQLQVAVLEQEAEGCTGSGHAFARDSACREKKLGAHSQSISWTASQLCRTQSLFDRPLGR